MIIVKELLVTELFEGTKKKNRVIGILTKNNEVIQDFICKFYDLLGDDWASDYASGEIYKKMQNGELIYVENYERSDGTKVHGYYRRRPYFSSKKSSK